MGTIVSSAVCVCVSVCVCVCVCVCVLYSFLFTCFYEVYLSVADNQISFLRINIVLLY